MNILSKFNLNPKKIMIILCVFIIIIVIGLFFSVHSLSKVMQKEEDAAAVYDYNEVERTLAEKVKAYLAQYIVLSDRISGEIADTAVQNYKIVIASNTDVINDEITEAVKRSIRRTIVSSIDNIDQFTDNDLDALASGITEIIWNTVLAQLSLLQSSLPADNVLQEDYFYLVQSLQEQIDDLKERKTKVSINARVIDNTDAEITGEAILTGIEDMSNEELRKLAQKLGLSVDDLKALTESAIAKSDKDISNEFKEKLDEEISDLKKELKKEIANAEGKTGATGEAGKKGEKGDKGEQGAAGKDGKSSFIRYATSDTGANMTTTPNSNTKYIGTYIGASASNNPADYTWTLYKDMIMTYSESDNTLYITQ